MFQVYNTRSQSVEYTLDSFSEAIDIVDAENDANARVGYSTEYEVRIVENGRTFLITVNDEL